MTYYTVDTETLTTFGTFETFADAVAYAELVGGCFVEAYDGAVVFEA